MSAADRMYLTDALVSSYITCPLLLWNKYTPEYAKPENSVTPEEAGFLRFVASLSSGVKLDKGTIRRVISKRLSAERKIYPGLKEQASILRRGIIPKVAERVITVSTKILYTEPIVSDARIALCTMEIGKYLYNKFIAYDNRSLFVVTNNYSTDPSWREMSDIDLWVKMMSAKYAAALRGIHLRKITVINLLGLTRTLKNGINQWDINNSIFDLRFFDSIMSSIAKGFKYPVVTRCKTCEMRGECYVRKGIT